MKRKRLRLMETKPLPPVQMHEVRLFGGPMNGQTLQIPRGTETINVGPTPVPFFTYTYAGREGQHDLFAIAPKKRVVKKFIFWYVGKHGKDPRIEAEYAKQRPYRRPPDGHPLS